MKKGNGLLFFCAGVQIMACKDTLAQQYLLDCVVQVFSDECHLQTLDQLLAQTANVQKGGTLGPVLRKSLLLSFCISYYRCAAGYCSVCHHVLCCLGCCSGAEACFGELAQKTYQLSSGRSRGGFFLVRGCRFIFSFASLFILLYSYSLP